MGQEWNLYDVAGARDTVRLLLNALIFIKKINLLTLGRREEHSILL